ncbi:hypothetical protein ACFOKI_04970 [Sphingomonas qilianensis]|uniref:STAS domain-containing protein n=1 Tax=Sphingomonas qilianensis TaxID=1736690 RepID=A0ABU9XUN4_9SPHN
MSVSYHDGAVHLIGDCLVEDAETLLALLQQHDAVLIDIGACTRLHLAVLQALLAAGGPIRGEPASAFIKKWLLPQLAGATA